LILPVFFLYCISPTLIYFFSFLFKNAINMVITFGLLADPTTEIPMAHKQIKSLMKKHHPDKNLTNPQATQMFQQIRDAQESLSTDGGQFIAVAKCSARLKIRLLSKGLRFSAQDVQEHFIRYGSSMFDFLSEVEERGERAPIDLSDLVHAPEIERSKRKYDEFEPWYMRKVSTDFRPGKRLKSPPAQFIPIPIRTNQGQSKIRGGRNRRVAPQVKLLRQQERCIRCNDIQRPEGYGCPRHMSLAQKQNRLQKKQFGYLPNGEPCQACIKLGDFCGNHDSQRLFPMKPKKPKFQQFVFNDYRDSHFGDVNTTNHHNNTTNSNSNCNNTNNVTNNHTTVNNMHGVEDMEVEDEDF
jgi:curved DNA-binding protein CbpA